MLGFPDSSVGEESACNAADPGSIPESGQFPRERIGYPLQYSWAASIFFFFFFGFQYSWANVIYAIIWEPRFYTEIEKKKTQINVLTHWGISITFLCGMHCPLSDALEMFAACLRSISQHPHPVIPPLDVIHYTAQ